MKRVKKVKKFKTKEMREQQIAEIKSKLSELGLSQEFSGIKEFYEIAEKYINEGVSWSGSIKLHGTKRILEARLPMREHIKCSVNLKYDENV